MKTRVFVTLKPSVFDPQGQTILDALSSLGYESVRDVRQGKFFELDVVADSAQEAMTISTEIADKLLANTVIEGYRVEVDPKRGEGD
ncbi:MAG: phosphoribosylformylglycinamidine synthase [Acidobacteria bacterium]|nr:phosphoribosylformylglycinamidine synthase [Acidobacteriota bacterium]